MQVAFKQTRVNDEVWLPSRLSIHGDARMGFLIKMHGDMEVTYRDYKKFPGGFANRAGGRRLR
jgi:hypothetical protein